MESSIASSNVGDGKKVLSFKANEVKDKYEEFIAEAEGFNEEAVKELERAVL